VIRSGRSVYSLMKFPDRTPGPEPGPRSCEETVKVLREIFQGYTDSKRALAADVDRLVLKGWPDRKTEVEAWGQLTKLVIECELLRFEYLLIHVPLESPIWTSLVTITQRLHTDWQASDESILREENPVYRETMRKLEAAEGARNPAALDGPFKNARRDPEYGAAVEAFTKKNNELDRQFDALRLMWPKGSSI
jgi:hypothetical protein